VRVLYKACFISLSLSQLMYHGHPNDFDPPLPHPPTNPISAITVSNPYSVIHLPGHLFPDVIPVQSHLCCSNIIRCRIKFRSFFTVRNSVCSRHGFVLHAEWFVHIWQIVRVLLWDIKCSLRQCFDMGRLVSIGTC
jgi:hypothetical protein